MGLNATQYAAVRTHRARNVPKSRIILFNKPYGVLSQFTAGPGQRSLAEFINSPGYYPAGRLDKDSEGLLLLTNDGKLQQRIANPRHKLAKTYLVQVEGDIGEEALQRLASGVELRDGHTRPARARSIPEPDLWPRSPPVRFRKHIPTSWIELTIREGKNRQVRRMTAAVGFPTLRLVRARIGCWRLAPEAGDYLQPGQWCYGEETES